MCNAIAKDGLPCPQCGSEDTHVQEDGMACAQCHHEWTPTEPIEREGKGFDEEPDVPTTPQEHVDEARIQLEVANHCREHEDSLRHLTRASAHASLAVAELLLEQQRRMDAIARGMSLGSEESSAIKFLERLFGGREDTP